MPKKKTKKVIKVKVPIFTEEYSVWVYIGEPEKCKEEAEGYLGEKVLDDLVDCRGRTYYKRGLHPLIVVRGEMPYTIALATLAHEASHALDDIMNYIGMDDRSGEFRAHGISAVLRAVGGLIKLSK